MALCALACTLCACADFTVVAATPAPSNITFVPPPTGFNHRFGNTPLSSKDGFALERALYSQNVFWEVAIRIMPEQAGYIPLSKPGGAKAARHAARSLLLVIATEDAHSIIGLLAEHGDTGQEHYAIGLLDWLRALGYDALTSATVDIYFTESDEHASLQWTRQRGYSFRVFDNDLRGTALTPSPLTTPLPQPGVP